eukprot:2731015-Rhodomonas_salina.2
MCDRRAVRHAVPVRDVTGGPRNGHVSTVRTLLEHRAAPDTVDTRHANALHNACCDGDVEIVRVSTRARACARALRLARFDGAQRCCAFDCGCAFDCDGSSTCAQPHRSPLASRLQMLVAAQLSEEGEEKAAGGWKLLDARDSDGWGPLHFAARAGKMKGKKGGERKEKQIWGKESKASDAWRAVGRFNHSDALEHLLLAGADPNLQDVDGWTAAHTSTRNGRNKCVQLLLEHRGDVCCVTRWGETSLHIACRKGKAKLCNCEDSPWMGSEGRQLGVGGGVGTECGAVSSWRRSLWSVLRSKNVSRRCLRSVFLSAKAFEPQTPDPIPLVVDLTTLPCGWLETSIHALPSPLCT